MGFVEDSGNCCVLELILLSLDRLHMVQKTLLWFETQSFPYLKYEDGLITLVNNGTCVKGTVECRILYCEREEREGR